MFSRQSNYSKVSLGYKSSMFSTQQSFMSSSSLATVVTEDLNSITQSTHNPSILVPNRSFVLTKEAYNQSRISGLNKSFVASHINSRSFMNRGSVRSMASRMTMDLKRNSDSDTDEPNDDNL
jgi:hypothetical protein